MLYLFQQSGAGSGASQGWTFYISSKHTNGGPVRITYIDKDNQNREYIMDNESRHAIYDILPHSTVILDPYQVNSGYIFNYMGAYFGNPIITTQTNAAYYETHYFQLNEPLTDIYISYAS